MLPEGWKEVKWAEISSIITKGATPTTYGFPFVEKGLNTARFIGGNNCTPNGKFNPSGEKWISEEANFSQKRSCLHENDIVICIVGNVGNNFLVSKEIIPANINQNVAKISTDTKYGDFNYIFQCVNSNLLKSQLLSEITTQAQPSLSLKQIGNLKILLPPLPEQKKIAAILSTWDRAIEGTEKLLANSQQQKKALMQQLLTGKKRLPGFTGEWRNLKLKTFLQESVIPSPQPDPKKRITVRLNLNGVEKREVRGTESIDATNYFTRKAGQFIYGKQNIHKGAFGIIPKSLDGFETSQDIPCFDFLPNVCPAWFFYYFARENIHNTLETKMTGTGSKRLNQKTFFNLTCLAPPLSEQKAIAAVLTTADEEITALESDLLRLRQEKKALMQQLLTGKRRVKVD